MSDACQVDFYVLQDASQSVEMLACRLALMAWEQGHRIFIMVETDTQMDSLDQLMWQNPQGRFLPHSKAGTGESAPVEIGTAKQIKDESRNVLINLTDQAVQAPDRFKRLLELVPATDTQRKFSRDKFRQYRDLGMQPASHPINLVN
jgi:DNA polymerase-3 subunit chi